MPIVVVPAVRQRDEEHRRRRLESGLMARQHFDQTPKGLPRPPGTLATLAAAVFLPSSILYGVTFACDIVNG